jgi:chromosomal replication initiator protein
MHDLWQNALNEMRQQLSTQDFEAWFRPIVCNTVGDDEIVLEVPHAFFEEWVRERYAELIAETLENLTNRSFKVSFVLAPVTRGAHAPGELQFEPMRSVSGPVAQPAMASTDDSTGIPALDLIDSYSFDTFVTGPSNQFCHAACRAVGDAPATNYNPLFIYGGVGLGKTHLLHAIGNEIRRKNPRARVKYISSESYINELIQCIRLDRMDEFRYRYRSQCDVLLIDDIQFIAGKDRTQEEFFHTFNSLYGSHKQIIVTSDKIPAEMPGLEERLRTRFQWGLIADIQAPEMETRIAILEKKAERENLALPEDVAMFLATHIQSNVRELEGSLIRLNAYASLTGTEVNLKMARTVLHDLLTDEGRRITCDRIIKEVSGFFNLKITDLKGPRRHKIISLPRMVAMFLCRKMTRESFPEIGRKFGGRDHSTVINAVTKVERLISTDSELARTVRALERQLGE